MHVHTFCSCQTYCATLMWKITQQIDHVLYVAKGYGSGCTKYNIHTYLICKHLYIPFWRQTDFAVNVREPFYALSTNAFTLS